MTPRRRHLRWRRRRRRGSGRSGSALRRPPSPPPSTASRPRYASRACGALPSTSCWHRSTRSPARRARRAATFRRPLPRPTAPGRRASSRSRLQHGAAPPTTWRPSLLLLSRSATAPRRRARRPTRAWRTRRLARRSSSTKRIWRSTMKRTRRLYGRRPLSILQRPRQTPRHRSATLWTTHELARTRPKSGASRRRRRGRPLPRPRPPLPRKTPPRLRSRARPCGASAMPPSTRASPPRPLRSTARRSTRGKRQPGRAASTTSLTLSMQRSAARSPRATCVQAPTRGQSPAFPSPQVCSGAQSEEPRRKSRV
mmetsp:Transcript_21039/g.72552  ORF Transcript_21039/g.72552 Transcript_21039/m.72552 type:complete len:312 (-) Transcript_21039:120-1055(-)